MKWRETASTYELRMCTRLQFPHSPQQSFLPVQAHWRVVVATWHFHVFQHLQAWVFDKRQHAPTCVSNKRAMHIVRLVTRARSRWLNLGPATFGTTQEGFCPCRHRYRAHGGGDLMAIDASSHHR